jgi:hypothetical protein
MKATKATIKKVTQRLDNVDLKSIFIRSYDEDNLYPQRTIDIVNDSGTAVTALRMFRKFVIGNGANDVDFGKAKINRKGTTVDRFIRKIVASKGNHTGIPIHFNYNALGEKTSISFVPFEYCRLTLESEDFPDRIAVYNDWGTTKRKKFDKEAIDYVYKYDPSKVFEQVQMEEGETDAEKWKAYKGQIWYWNPDGDEYPLSPFDSVLEDMITEGQTKRFKTNTATTNFTASHVFITGVEEGEPDAEGNPTAINPEDSFAKVIEVFQGAEGAGAQVHVQREEGDVPFEIKKVDIQNYDGLYEFTENSARDSIIRNFLIPPVLLVQTSGSLGTSKEISDASKYYNGITSSDRNEIEEILTETFKDFHFDINPSGDYSIQPLQFKEPIELAYFPYYTKNEIRESNGDDAVEDTDSGKTILAVELGVGGTQSLTSIVSDAVLTTDQKKGSLKVLFGLSDADIELMLGTGAANPNVQ